MGMLTKREHLLHSDGPHPICPIYF